MRSAPGASPGISERPSPDSASSGRTYQGLSSGTEQWGSGLATPDTMLARIAAGVMAFLGTDLLVGEDGGKAYMLRQSGDALDLDASGADLHVSVFELDDFAGAQREYLRLESGIQLAHAIGKWVFSDSPTGAAIHTIDGAADQLGFHGAAPVTRQTISGGRSDGTALASLLSALNTLGLIDDGSSAGQVMLAATNNLSELTNPALARTSLGLGNSATLNVGTVSSTVAAGNDSRITGAAQKSANLSDLADAASARTNLGLGSSAVRDVPANVFDITRYGAVGNGRLASDGAMTSGSAVLTCASGPFVVGDVGKSVMVLAAGTSGETLVGTISGYTSATQVTLSATAASTVTGVPALWASDDTVAIQAAVDAAVAYALAHSYAATVYIPPATGAFYGVAGVLKAGGSTLGNSQITLPVVPTTGRKMTLTIEGAQTGAGVQHWQQTVPNLTGSTLLSFGMFANATAQTNSINAGGNPSVIGGPSQPGGYGVAPGVYSNLYIDIGNLAILTCHSRNGLTYTALDFSGIANAQLRDLACSTSGAVAPPAGSYQNPNLFATGLAIGILMPACGNNDLNIIRNVTIGGGYTYGLLATEHTDIYGLRILYCWAALCPVGTYYSSVGAAHSIAGTLISIEQCTFLIYIFGPGTGGIGPTMYLRIDTETSVPRFGDRTSGTGLEAARGEVILAGLFTAANLTLDAPTGLKIRNSQLTYPSTAKTANYTATTFDEVILADATSGTITVSLPTAAGRTDPITVKKIDSSANPVTVDASGSQTIDGQLIKRLDAQWDHVTLVPYNGNWYVRSAPTPATWRRRSLPDPVLVDSLYAGAAPTIGTAQTGTPTSGYVKYAPSGVTLAGTDVTGPFKYLGAGNITVGTGTPDSTYVLPTSRYPNTRGTLTSSQSVWTVEFGTDAQTFQLRFNYQTAGMYRLSIDGRKVTDLMQAVGGTTPGSTHLMTIDLGSAAPRVIRLDFYTVPFGGVFLPPGATMWSTVPKSDRFMVFGDSLSDGSAVNTGGGGGTWAHRAARILGSNDYWNESRGGTGYITAGSFATLANRVALDVIGWNPNRLVIWAGYNDNGGVQLDISTAAASLYATIRAGLPNTDVFIVGCWSPTGSPASSITNTDNTLKAAAAAAGYPFISPVTGSIYNASGTLVATHGAWITGTGHVGATTGTGNADIYVGSDAVHPTDEGHVYLARRISAAIRELMPA